MIKHPSCSSCKDGIIQVVMDGPRRPYQFKLIGPGRETDAWSQADTYLGFVKTFRNLGVGKYTLFIDSDDSFDKTTCISTYDIVLEDPCPEEINCGECEFALNVRRKDGPTTLDNTVIGQGVRFLNRNPATDASPFVHYQFGRKPYSLEFWFQPRLSKVHHSTIPLFYRSNHRGNNLHWRNIFTGPSLTNKHVYQLLGLRKANASSPFRLFLEYGVSINDANTYLASDPVSTTHEFLRLISDQTFVENQLLHIALIVEYADTTGPAYAFNAGDITMYVNGVMITTTSPGGVTNTLSVAHQTLLSTVNNFIGPVLLGMTDSDHGGTGVNGRYSAHGVFTNFRYYSRALSKFEVQNNYLQGCRGEPTSCDDLILWAPLSQAEGGIAFEKRYFNNGSLAYFKGTEYARGGGSWVKDCCGQISDVTLMDCPVEDCVKNAVLIVLRVSRFEDVATPVVIGLALRVFDPNDTPYYTVKYNTVASLADKVEASDIVYESPAPLVVGDRTPAVIATEIAAQINANAYWSGLGATATAVEDTIRIVIPYSRTTGVSMQTWCGKGVFAKAFRPSANPAIVGTTWWVDNHGNATIGSDSGKYTVCCAPSDCNIGQELDIKI